MARDSILIGMLSNKRVTVNRTNCTVRPISIARSRLSAVVTRLRSALYKVLSDWLVWVDPCALIRLRRSRRNLLVMIRREVRRAVGCWVKFKADDVALHLCDFANLSVDDTVGQPSNVWVLDMRPLVAIGSALSSAADDCAVGTQARHSDRLSCACWPGEA
jgi:hypothetical protein